MTSPVDRAYTPAVPSYTPIDDPPPAPTPDAQREPVVAHYDTPLVPPLDAASSDAPGIALEHNPDAALDHQADALRARLGREVDYAGRGGDQKELAGVEGEMTRRQQAARAPDSVELCKRAADLPLNEYIGAEHHWIRTSKKEVGMGPADGSIPGHDSLAGLPGAKTTLNDHSTEIEKHCEKVPDEDEDCVNRELEVGKDTGRWVPPFNDCHTIVQDILDRCWIRP